MKDEIVVLVVHDEKLGDVVSAFTDRETAVKYFKKYMDKGASIHSIEIGSVKNLIEMDKVNSKA